MSNKIYKVKYFTEKSSGKSCPRSIVPFTLDQYKWLCKMVFSEMTELVQTLCDNKDEAIKIVKDSIMTTRPPRLIESVDMRECPTAFSLREITWIINSVSYHLYSSKPNDVLIECVGTDVKDHIKPTDPIDIIAEQADALVDAIYYIMNTSCKHGLMITDEVNSYTKEFKEIIEILYKFARLKGIDLDPIFDIVHKFNMSKRHDDGTFHLREDGKIIKPPNFNEKQLAINLRNEIQRQIKESPWV